MSAEPQLRARKVVFIPDLIPQPDWDKYIALFFEAVRKSTDLADGLTRVFEESKGVLLSGRDANSP